MTMQDKYSNAIFDDYTNQDPADNFDTKLWTQVCIAHIREYKFVADQLDDGGSGICGVVGCLSESYYYYDFNPKD